MTLPLISQRKSKPSGGIPHLSTLTHHPSTSTLAFLPPPCPKARPLPGTGSIASSLLRDLPPSITPLSYIANFFPSTE